MRVALSNEAPAGASGSGVSEVGLGERAHFGAAQGWRAALTLELERRGAKTVLARARHVGPLRVQRPFYPEASGACHVYVLHPPGGVASGDQLTIEARLEAGAHALITTPGASKLYRSRGLEAQITQRVSVAEAACLEWLPQECIVFDGAEASLTTEIELAPGARYAGWEIVCLGRPASGERFTRGRLQTALRLWRGGRLGYVERGAFAGGDAVLSEAWGLGGAPVFGLFVVADERADDDWVERVREAVGPAEGGPAESARRDGLFAVTRVAGVVLGRYLGHSTLDARARFESMFAALRPLYADSAPITPRIWRT